MFMLTHLALTGVPVMLAVKPQTFMCICFQREQKDFFGMLSRENDRIIKCESVIKL